MIVGVPRETQPGERRVALAPVSVSPLSKAGYTIRIESGAGTAAGFSDEDFTNAGATIEASRADLFAGSEILLQIRALGANPEGSAADLSLCRSGQTLIALTDPLGSPEAALPAAQKGLTVFSLELVPRITRAQAMDVLSSQANLAGYKSVLMAADALPKILPMMITAAGSIAPARVFIVGAGVAGLQAIATAKRLGGVVSAYDVRPAVKEQVESVGARFVELEVATEGGEAAGGYAKAMGEEFYRRQAELMGGVVADSDIVITTAAVPGQKAPILITREMVERMRPGSVVVDLAAERGGNCEVTQPGQTIVHKVVVIMGPLNIPGLLPFNASQLFSRNIATFLSHLGKKGEIAIDLDDEITRETLVTRGGEVVHAKIRERLELPPLAPPAQAPVEASPVESTA